MFNTLKTYVLGKPLTSRSAKEERLTNPQGLAIFGADALSSTAYATEEILLVLAGVGSIAFFVSIPIAIVIAVLILIVSVSYRQVMRAYPQGGGVYTVARQNLGEYPALLGAASLLVDYVLTAAVSVAAGIAAVTSAFPALFSHRVLLGVLVIFFLMWANLRGVRESGKLFAIPTYLFIGAFLGMIGYGIYRHFIGTFPVATYDGLATQTAGALGIILILRAFASGCTAMTGIEATSNGVQAFHQPESSNAAKTLLTLAFILGIIFIGVTLLVHWGGIYPLPSETVISQIARLLFGSSWFYFLIQGFTALILLLAANTPFAGFPRIASQLAKDDYFPRQFFNIGTRLVFANGIMLLALASALFIVLFQGSVHALIPLYAVGVFLGFSLSQFGMVLHWRRAGAGHRKNILINAVGFGATAIVFCVVFFSKFLEGAWILIPAIAFLIFSMKQIHNHYALMRRVFNLDHKSLPKILPDKLMIILISHLDWGAAYAIQVARSFRPAHIRAFHAAISEKEKERLRREWDAHGFGDIPFDIETSEYRDLIGSVLEYVKKIEKQWHRDEIIIVIPEIIPPRFWHFFLHNQIAFRLRLAIEQDPEVHAEILDVPVKRILPFSS